MKMSAGIEAGNWFTRLWHEDVPVIVPVVMLIILVVAFVGVYITRP